VHGYGNMIEVANWFSRHESSSSAGLCLFWETGARAPTCRSPQWVS
jgi:hypothetical protein